jgi:hypothetical protein
MNNGWRPNRSRLAARLAAAACLCLPACSSDSSPLSRSYPTTAPVDARAYRELPSSGTAVVFRPPEPFRPGVPAAEARAAVIRRDADAIRAECQRAAGGDWDRWQNETEPYRAALKARVAALKASDTPHAIALEALYEAMEANDGFPLFEVGARDHLNYLYAPASLTGFREERPVVAAHHWLKKRGIDLIFVPAPKMTEIYSEHFFDPCPPDGIVAPHVRRALMELLDAGVEVVDAFSLFRSYRYSDSEYLYNTADPHWAPRAMRIMAREVADRVARYDFATRARYALPVVRAEPGPYLLDFCPGGIGSPGGWSVLTNRQARRATAVQPTKQACILLQSGIAPPDDPKSPVLLMGHSYTANFREQLIRELNLSFRTCAGAGYTTESFLDFLRSPELLDGCRVVIWVTTEQHMTHFKPLPPPVAAAAASD